MIKLKQLEHALALDKHRSFKDAAIAERISQPAFSRSIKNLEVALQTTLFSRSEPVTPTQYGERVLAHAAIVMRAINDLEADLNNLRSLQTGSLRIGMGTHANEISGALATAAMAVEYPGVSLYTRGAPWIEIIQGVQAGELELGFADTSELSDTKSIATETIGMHEAVLFCSHAHPLAKRQRVTDDDLAPFPMVMTRLPARGHRVPGRGTTPGEHESLVPHIQVEELDSARTIVAHSDAFGLTTAVQIEPWLRSGELEILGYRRDWLRLNYGFFYLTDRLLSAQAYAFMTKVREIEVERGKVNKDLMGVLFDGDKRSRRKL